MIQTLKDIFDKKSPLFMITIIIFIVSLLLKSEPINHTCSLQTHISVFQIVLIVATGTEIFVKTILLEILSKCCISSITGIHYALVIFFVTVSLGMYGWSTQLLLQSRKEGGCQQPNQPHYFFLQVYSFLYTVIYSIIAITLISLKLQNKTMTVLGQDSHLQIQDQP